MPNFNDFVTQLKQAITQLAASNWSAFKDAAIKDGSDFITSAGDQLKTWTSDFASGKMTEAEFQDLVAGETDLVQVVALKQAGLAQQKLKEFQVGVLNAVVQTAVKVFA